MAQICLMMIIPGLIAYGAVSDLMSMTISNRLCLALFGLFPVVALASGMPLTDVGMHLLAGLAVLLVTFGLFAAGWIGGGDAKFAAALVTWLGLPLLLPYLVMTAVGGGFLTLGFIWLKQNQMPALALRMPWYAQLQDQKSGVPYGIALSLVALLMLPDALVWRLALGG